MFYVYINRDGAACAALAIVQKIPTAPVLAFYSDITQN